MAESTKVHDVALAVAQAGGSATWADLRRRAHGRDVRRAVEAGLIVRAGRGRYCLASVTDAQNAAHASGGVLSHRSAALHLGLGVWRAPDRPEIIVPRHRNLDLPRRRGLDVRWRSLAPEDTIDGLVTGPLRTVLDCARDLPLVEALAVADSALRRGDITPDEARRASATLPAQGRSRARQVLALADARAANPFESALRGLSIEAVGPIFTPQVPIDLGTSTVRPDLVCEELRIVAEGDSAAFHTSRGQIHHDCWRYDELTLEDWLVLRFAWGHAMRTPEWTRETFRRAVTRRAAAA